MTTSGEPPFAGQCYSSQARDRHHLQRIPEINVEVCPIVDRELGVTCFRQRFPNDLRGTQVVSLCCDEKKGCFNLSHHRVHEQQSIATDESRLGAREETVI